MNAQDKATEEACGCGVPFSEHCQACADWHGDTYSHPKQPREQKPTWQPLGEVDEDQLFEEIWYGE